jgi:hypothetical protein
MRQTITNHTTNEISSHSPGRLPVLILAANDHSRIRALNCCLEQLRLIGDLAELDIHMEFFANMNSSENRDFMLSKLCDSGLVFVSTDSETGLPVATHICLEKFFEAPTQEDTAVIGLYACSPDLPLLAEGFHEFLGEIVQSKSLPYFGKTIFSSELGQRRDPSLSQKIAHIYPVDHWGLNE